MKLNFKKIGKYLAVAIFFTALYFNVKVSLDDPFLYLSNNVIAQTTSSSSSSSDPSSVKVPCDDVPDFGHGPIHARICLDGQEKYCQFNYHGHYSHTHGTCDYD